MPAGPLVPPPAPPTITIAPRADSTGCRIPRTVPSAVRICSGVACAAIAALTISTRRTRYCARRTERTSHGRTAAVSRPTWAVSRNVERRHMPSTAMICRARVPGRELHGAAVRARHIGGASDVAAGVYAGTRLLGGISLARDAVALRHGHIGHPLGRDGLARVVADPTGRHIAAARYVGCSAIGPLGLPMCRHGIRPGDVAPDGDVAGQASLDLTCGVSRYIVTIRLVVVLHVGSPCRRSQSHHPNRLRRVAPS